MPDEIDLEKGDPGRAEKIAERQAAGSSRSRSRRSETGKTSGDGKSSSGGSKKTPNLKNDLKDAFTRLGDLRGAKGDEELATALKEEADSMAQGLVSMTRAVPFLQGPILFFLAILVPTLAFWRVGGILAGRFVDRRERIAAEQQRVATGTEPVPPQYEA